VTIGVLKVAPGKAYHNAILVIVVIKHKSSINTCAIAMNLD